MLGVNGHVNGAKVNGRRRTFFNPETGRLKVTGHRASSNGNKRKPPSAARRRYFDIGQVSETLGWNVDDVSANAAIYQNLWLMKSRARDLARNNDYVRRSLQIFDNNVIGPLGFTLSCKLRDGNGKTCDRGFRSKLHAAWSRAGKLRNRPTTNGQLTRKDAYSLWFRTLIVDGEVIVIGKPGFGNEARWSLQFIDTARLDHRLNQIAPNGNRIIMGVEVDADDAPVAYWFLNRLPSDLVFPYQSDPQEHQRIEARYVNHTFVVERPGQSRGVSWLASPATRARHLDQFEEAIVVGSRVAASKMGFYVPDENYEGQAPGDEDPSDPAGDLRQDAEPGTFEVIPRGMTVENFDPNYPPGNLEEFQIAILRGIASGIGIDYVSISNNLKGVNYNSLRSGALEQRPIYEGLQNFVIDHFVDWDFRQWGAVQDLNIDAYPGVNRRKLRSMMELDSYGFDGRKWQWVDPEKEGNAEIKAIEMKLKTRAMVIRNKANIEPDQMFQDIADEEAELEELGIETPTIFTKPDASNENESTEEETGETGEAEDDADAILSGDD